VVGARQERARSFDRARRHPGLGRAPENNNPDINRYPLTSWGAGLRVNLFNLAILRWDYARPLATGRKPNWTFSLGASY